MTLMLLLNFNVLLGQTNVNLPLRGNADSLVVVNIELIKKANLKLAERNYLEELTNQQAELIFDLEELVELKNEQIKGISVNNYQLQKDNENLNNLNNSLQKSLDKSKKVNWILGGVAGTAIIITVLNILIK